MNAQTAQPKWREIWCSDYARIEVDTTGVYDPEMEIADEIQDAEDRFQLFRFALPRLKIERGYLVTANYADDWPHPLPAYEEWFVASLDHVANACGTTEDALWTALCSADPIDRAEAYELIGAYHGLENFDSYSREISGDELNTRWGRL